MSFQASIQLTRETKVPASTNQINAFLQDELRKGALDEVPAVEAASWLDAAGSV